LPAGERQGGVDRRASFGRSSLRLRGQIADEDLDRVVNVLFSVRYRVLSPMTKARRAPVVARARATDGNLL